MNRLPPNKPSENTPSGGPRRLRLPAESACPALSKVRVLLEEAQSKRGTLIEMPWSQPDHKSFIITVQWDETL